MATPPDFTAGAVLTAAQMNAVGLWHVDTVVGGNGVSSLAVPDVFSADFYNYRVIIRGGTIATGTNVRMRLGASATGYYAAHEYISFAALQILGGDVNATYWTSVGRSTPTNGTDATFDLYNPFEAARTRIHAMFVDMSTTGGAQTSLGYHNTATSYTGFTIYTTSGNWTSDLTVTVYGYRN